MSNLQKWWDFVQRLGFCMPIYTSYWAVTLRHRSVKVDTNYVHRGHWQHITFVHVSHKYVWNFRSEESSTISSANHGQDEGDETEDDEDLQNLIEESSTDFERKSIRRNVNWQDLKLPDTCTMLTTNQGAKIFIIGTAHFSRFVLKN